MNHQSTLYHESTMGCTRHGMQNDFWRLGVFTQMAVRLLEAGYMDGQEYEHCLKMADWHPKMDAFLKTLPGEKGSEDHQRNFALIKTAVPNAIRFNENRSSSEPENRLFRTMGEELLQAGYQKGDTYEDCVKKSETNPSMAEFLKHVHVSSFGYAVLHADELMDNAH